MVPIIIWPRIFVSPRSIIIRIVIVLKRCPPSISRIIRWYWFVHILWTHLLGDIRCCIGSGVLRLEAIPSVPIKYDSPPISVDLFDQCILINMNPPLVGLVHFQNIHKTKHVLDSLPHSVITHTGTAHTRLTVSGDYVN